MKDLNWINKCNGGPTPIFDPLYWVETVLSQRAVSQWGCYISGY
jgi:hypothetical protein